jgi:hypothetical protein
MTDLRTGRLLCGSRGLDPVAKISDKGNSFRASHQVFDGFGS